MNISISSNSKQCLGVHRKLVILVLSLQCFNPLSERTIWHFLIFFNCLFDVNESRSISYLISVQMFVETRKQL